MRLIVAEKPSMARSIATALGVTVRSHGCIVGTNEIVTWCIGHVVKLADPKAYGDVYERWSLDTLPMVPEAFLLVPVEETKDQFRVVRDLIARANVHEVVNACDSGREGELIFDYLYRLAQGTKPVLRLWTASLTDEAIRTAYKKLKPAAAYAGLRHAGRSRSEADWLVGMNATRAQTLTAQAAGHRGVWSLGRVQTPTLALIVDRDRAIRTFAPKDYWTVEAALVAADGPFTARWFRKDGERLVEQLDRDDDAKRVTAAARRGPARVVEVDAKDARVPAELLYDLTTLQREANRRFGYSAQRTLELAQALYEEHKVLSYPRTNSRHLTTDVAATLPPLLAQLERQPAFAAAAAQARARAAPLGGRFVDDGKVEDHHALIPTGKVPGQLDEAERRIYELVVRRLLGAFFPERIEARTNVTCEIGGEPFRARGVVVRAAGWADVDPPHAEATEKKKEDDARALPRLVVGEHLQITSVKSAAKKTKPPRPYSEAELLGAMETAGKTLDDEEQRLAMRESGLGTPATRAAIIENLLHREYIERVRKNLEPTDRGRALIDGLQSKSLKSAQLTGEWEAKLARMARGEYARATFMREVGDFTREVVRQIVSAAPAPAAPAPGPVPTLPAPPAAPCPTCRQPLRAVWSSTQSAWHKRCDPCGQWV